ncbi:beta-caryophyllene synthase isoform X2 [Sesamum indicum]|uniref:Beta-caryophyllene synthase isoform X2 n=1 Tax=Sesamum indicum TaxID=4182 RepID=A0A8M8V5E3_SESIN|nr:beta-caryophyllene synthase isoform X2 [Sesamum indicum]
MEFESLNVPIFTKEVDIDEIRRAIKYHPSVWGKYFLTYASTEISSAEEEELQRQKNMVRTMLAQTPDDSLQKLELIDVVQRLGSGYHFEEEIDKSLRYIHDTYLEYTSKDNDLRTTALRFRLLRQQGYPLSCDVFDKFLDGEGNFEESLVENVEGLLELYEAAHFGVHGEEILDKAMEFSSSKLKYLLPNMNCSLSTRVKAALETSIRKSLSRLGPKKFIPMYQHDKSCNEILLNFAKLDYNIVQKLHQKELSEITRWDANALEQVPAYLKICYEALSDVYIEMENEVKEIGELYRVQYAKEEMKKLVRAYLEETKWSYSKDTPTMEEYMKVAIVTATYMMLSTTSLVGMGNLVTKKDFDWVTSEPLLVIASSAVCRLTNDVVGYGFEQKRAAVHCYMNQYGVSKEEAVVEIRKLTKKAWKDMNQECLQPTPVSVPVLTRVVNLARIVHLFYDYADEYSNSKINIKDVIYDVLVEPL